MKVLLVSPNFLSNEGNYKQETSLGILYLATEIQELCETYVIDAF